MLRFQKIGVYFKLATFVLEFYFISVQTFEILTLIPEICGLFSSLQLCCKHHFEYFLKVIFLNP